MCVRVTLALRDVEREALPVTVRVDVRVDDGDDPKDSDALGDSEIVGVIDTVSEAVDVVDTVGDADGTVLGDVDGDDDRGVTMHDTPVAHVRQSVADGPWHARHELWHAWHDSGSGTR
jgi:hypothetical protein